jgi:subtilase family serine protease
VPGLSRIDLVQRAVSSAPPNIAPDWRFDLTDTVDNRGSDPSATAITRFFLSADFARDASDIQLKGGRYVPELPTSVTSTETTTLTVPSGAALGTYHLLACADALGNVSEWNESNNCLVADGTVTVARPDLVTTVINPVANTAYPGGKLAVGDAVQNNSSAGALASSSRYYLSLDGSKDSSDTLLSGKRSIPVLGPDGQSSGAATVAIPTGVIEATYHVLACADDLKKLSEADESNNCRASTSPVMVGWPDLVLTSLSDPPTEALRGSKFILADSVVNQGTVPSGGSSTRHYLSLDLVKSTGDTLLTGKRSFPILAPSATSTGKKSVAVPLTVSVGTYYVIACADDLSQVSERIETNNCRTSTSTITIR